MTKRILLSFGFVLAVSSGGRADVKLPAAYGDHMVLQREVAVPVWGWATPGREVRVAFAGQTRSAKAGADGRWMVRLEAMKASAEGRLLTVSGDGNTVTLQDVLVGDVWLASGQSNMDWKLRNVDHAGSEIAAAEKHPTIRLFYVPLQHPYKPKDDCGGQWRVCDANTAKNFSAVAYVFGREVQDAVGVPVGLVGSYVPGTRVEAWMSRAALGQFPAGAAELARLDDVMSRYDANAARGKYEAATAVYREKLKAYQAAKEAGQKVGRAPLRPQLHNPCSHGAASALFNGMIAPLAPMALRGAIWYQGESNAGNAHAYRDLLAAMIADWRKAFDNKDLPFLFVQLPGIKGRSTWTVLRDSMLHVQQTVPGAAMVVTIDLGEPGNVHPRRKVPVGQRLALAARALVYGQDVVWSGPAFRAMKVQGSKAELSFDHVAGELVARGEKLDGFTIAGKDANFVPAEAKVVGDKVVVWSDRVSEPAAVRYAWEPWPAVTLWNSAKLPASPFRTDDWPVPTQPAKP